MTQRQNSSSFSIHSRLIGALACLSRMCRRQPLVVLGIAALAVVLGGFYTATNLRVDTSTLDMLSKELPFWKNHNALDKAFPQDYRQIIVVVEGADSSGAAAAAERLATALQSGTVHIRDVFYPDGDPFFARNGLLYLDPDALEEVIGDLAAAQPLLASINDDMTLRGVSGILGQALDWGRNTDDERFAALLDHIAAIADGVAGNQPESMNWRAAIGAEAAAPMDGRRRFLLVEPVLDFAALQPSEAAIMEIRQTVARLDFASDLVSVRLTGEPVMMAEELESVQTGMGLVGAISFVLVVGLLWLGLRSFRLLGAAVITLIIGLILTATFATLAIGTLNLISVAFAVLFIGLSVDFSIHFTLRTKELVGRLVPRGLALDEAAASVGGSIILSAVAAAIGFLAFLPTAYRGLSELGLIAGVGMLIAAVATLTVVPAILALWPLKRRDGRTPAPVWRERYQRFIDDQGKPIVAVAVVLAIGAAYFATLVRFDDSPLNLRDPDSPSMMALSDLYKDPRIDPFRALILSSSLEEARDLRQKLLALDQVAEVITIEQLVPAEQDLKLSLLDDASFFLAPLLKGPSAPDPLTPEERRQAFERLKSAASAAVSRGDATAERLARTLDGSAFGDEQLIDFEAAVIGDLPDVLQQLATALTAEAVTIDDLPIRLVQRSITDDGRALVQVFPATDLRLQHNRRNFAAAVASIAPNASGEAIIVTEAGYAVIAALYQAGLISAVAVTVLLIVVLRSVLDTISVTIPLALAGLFTVAVSVIAGEPFNFANVIVVPLLFGLGVASGIHLVVRDRQATGRTAITSSTSRAVLFSALTTIGSFGALSISPHPGTASMGTLLTIAILLSTVCMMLVLPAIRRIGIRRQE